MRLSLNAIGRLKSGPEADLVSIYKKRIEQSAPALGFQSFALNEFDAPKISDDAKRRMRESELLLGAFANGARLIALDERGRQHTSVQFSKKLASWRDDGAPSAIFVIGGADGLSGEILERAHEKMALGVQTWPHMLARVMLCEQIYRAMTIISGHPYHRP